MGDRRLMNAYLVQLALGMSAREFFWESVGSDWGLWWLLVILLVSDSILK